jgi:hypothetical protein
MSKQHRLLSVLAAAAGGLAAAAFLPVALAYADDCSLGDCTLVSGGNPYDVVYNGIRPDFSNWKDIQPTNVEVTQGDTSFVSGTYDVQEEDYESARMDHAEYHFGTFTPSADNPTGIDSDNLAGATVNDVWRGPFGTNAAGDPTYHSNTLQVLYADGAHTMIKTVPGEYTKFLVGDGHASGEWILYAGQTTPKEIWDSLPSSQFPAEYIDTLQQNIMPPDDWFPFPNSDLGNVTDLGNVADLVSALDFGSATDLASTTADLASVTPELASLAPDLASLAPDLTSLIP